MNAGAAAVERHEQPAAEGTPDQPVEAGERIVTLDFIRGIAVLGILTASSAGCSRCFSAPA